MHTRSLLLLGFAVFGLALLEPASANTLRCGSVLIEPGDDAAYVLEHCGVPTLSSQPNESSYRTRPSGNLYPYQGIAMRADRWRYDRGPGKLPVVLTIGDDGRVAAIEFEQHRTDPFGTEGE
jgi:hypothetical protein